MLVFVYNPSDSHTQHWRTKAAWRNRKGIWCGRSCAVRWPRSQTAWWQCWSHAVLLPHNIALVLRIYTGLGSTALLQYEIFMFLFFAFLWQRCHMVYHWLIHVMQNSPSLDASIWAYRLLTGFFIIMLICCRLTALWKAVLWCLYMSLRVCLFPPQPRLREGQTLYHEALGLVESI